MLAPDFAEALERIIRPLRDRVIRLEGNSRAEVGGGMERLAFADLPAAGQAGRVRFVTNGRKVGEGAGAGTGVPAYDDGTNWYRFSDDTPVAI